MPSRSCDRLGPNVTFAGHSHVGPSSVAERLGRPALGHDECRAVGDPGDLPTHAAFQERGMVTTRPAPSDDQVGVDQVRDALHDLVGPSPPDRYVSGHTTAVKTQPELRSPSLVEGPGQAVDSFHHRDPGVEGSSQPASDVHGSVRRPPRVDTDQDTPERQMLDAHLALRDDQHRNLRGAQDVQARAPQRKRRRRTATAVADDDEVGVLLLRDGQQDIRGVALPDNGPDTDLVRSGRRTPFPFQELLDLCPMPVGDDQLIIEPL